MHKSDRTFHKWKDFLETASRKVESFTSKHPKILGTLLSLIGGKDISDFSDDGERWSTPVSHCTEANTKCTVVNYMKAHIDDLERLFETLAVSDTVERQAIRLYRLCQFKNSL